jgi:succinate-semialdehyde dehydrogenase/glutarate-semialdehyde dehydrogenase
VRTDLFIGGKWVPGSEGAFHVLDPASEEKIASVARVGLDDLDRAISAADDAQPAWAATPPRERSEVLRRSFEAMIARRDEIAALIVREMGKSLADAVAEVTYAAEFLRWFAEEAVRIDGELRTAPGGANRILTFRKPVGVALLLTPWNFPAAMATRKIGPALAAGCTVVLKPAEDTPLTALLLAEIFADADVPDGVVNVVTTDRPGDIATAGLADGRVRTLSFTGSTRVGRLLLAQAADRVVNCSMELGGNAPFIVLEDADLDAAVAGAMLAKMRNYGQACTAANRFLVHESVAVEFTEKLVFRDGRGAHWDVDQRARGGKRVGHGGFLGWPCSAWRETGRWSGIQVSADGRNRCSTGLGSGQGGDFRAGRADHDHAGRRRRDRARQLHRDGPRRVRLHR